MATDLPNRKSAAVFWLKSSILKAARAVKDLRSDLAVLPRVDTRLPVLLGESRSPLWSEGAETEIALQRGKVHNLRIACHKLNGVLVLPGKTFSFWRNVKRATKRRGYVLGRQLREGCIYPEIGGGLCQLSNALYDAAEKSGLEIVERHPHTIIIPGSAAELGRDATVAWNYIDLRFKSESAFQIVAELTSSELSVRIHGESAKRVSGGSIALTKFDRSILDVQRHSCTTCGEVGCFRHPRAVAATTPCSGRTAYVLDDLWPEFGDFVQESRADGDFLLIPIDGRRFSNERYAWPTEGFAKVQEARWELLRRAFASRRLATYGAARLSAQLKSAEAITRRLVPAMDADTVGACVSQNFLPFLWRGGHLGGRTFTILANRLPLRLLHARLDEAAAKWPERRTLSEFRAPNEIVQWEWEAFEAANEVVTPNVEIAALFGERAKLIPWKHPEASSWQAGKTVVFPGPSAARKGAYELREVARRLDLNVVLLGSELEGIDFWNGVRIRRMSANEDWLDGAGVLVQPALVEERPRAVLKAIANGLPVVATPHCGVALGAMDRSVGFGCPDELEIAIKSALSITC